ncbi:MAG: hypothetical protein ACK55Z_10865, partial [bacterium]
GFLFDGFETLISCIVVSSVPKVPVITSPFLPLFYPNMKSKQCPFGYDNKDYVSDQHSYLCYLITIFISLTPGIFVLYRHCIKMYQKETSA